MQVRPNTLVSMSSHTQTVCVFVPQNLPTSTLKAHELTHTQVRTNKRNIKWQITFFAPMCQTILPDNQCRPPGNSVVFTQDVHLWAFEVQSLFPLFPLFSVFVLSQPAADRSFIFFVQTWEWNQKLSATNQVSVFSVWLFLIPWNKST